VIAVEHGGAIGEEKVAHAGVAKHDANGVAKSDVVLAGASSTNNVSSTSMRVVWRGTTTITTAACGRTQSSWPYSYGGHLQHHYWRRAQQRCHCASQFLHYGRHQGAHHAGLFAAPTTTPTTTTAATPATTNAAATASTTTSPLPPIPDIATAAGAVAQVADASSSTDVIDATANVKDGNCSASQPHC
jgi:hypothetical protein